MCLFTFRSVILCQIVHQPCQYLNVSVQFAVVDVQRVFIATGPFAFAAQNTVGDLDLQQIVQHLCLLLNHNNHQMAMGPKYCPCFRKRNLQR